VNAFTVFTIIKAKPVIALQKLTATAVFIVISLNVTIT